MLLLLAAEAAQPSPGSNDNLTLILVALIGVAGLVAAAAIPLWFQARNMKRRADETHELVKGIDGAVNQKLPEEPTIRENVAALREIAETTQTTVEILGDDFRAHLETDKESFDTIRQNHRELINIIAEQQR